jgi:hypothetical protein
MARPVPKRNGRPFRPGRTATRVVVLGVVVAALLFGVVTHVGSTPSPASRSTTVTSTAPAASAPDPEDVAAARACAAFSTYLADASRGTVPRAVGENLTNAAYALVAGATAKDQGSSAASGRWTTLGEDLVAAADDVVQRDSGALSKDGTAAAEACQTIPAAARAAGGYEPTTTPAPSPVRPSSSPSTGG